MPVDAMNNAESDADTLAARLLADTDAFLREQPQFTGGWPRAHVEAIQLHALRRRFSVQRDAIPMLTRLADELGVQAIASLDDAVPLLFKHTVYKSYPVSLLEQGRFGPLTAWLRKLTTVDLGALDVTQCRSIDAWIEHLDAHSPIGLLYSSGTSGAMSFIPRSRAEAERQFLRNHAALFTELGLAPPTREQPLSMRVILNNYRSSAAAWGRNNDYRVRFLCGGDESRAISLYPGRASADVLFLAGRLRAAAQRGETQRLRLSPELLARRAEFEAFQRDGANHRAHFHERIFSELGGQRIFIQAPSSALHAIAAAGLERGLSGFFAPESIVVSAGGAKGQVVPDDWEDTVCHVFGVSRIEQQYGMSETHSANAMCTQRRYHVSPLHVLYLLDPDSGAVLPRDGVRTGRAAFFDLMAESYWGGFISGDEITVDWDTPCACGRLTPHIAPRIERYADQRGGDDKISCAAASDAHEAALDYLLDGES